MILRKFRALCSIISKLEFKDSEIEFNPFGSGGVFTFIITFIIICKDVTNSDLAKQPNIRPMAEYQLYFVPKKKITFDYMYIFF